MRRLLTPGTQNFLRRKPAIPAQEIYFSPQEKIFSPQEISPRYRRGFPGAAPRAKLASMIQAITS